MTKVEFLNLLERRIQNHEYARNANLTLLETNKFPRVYMRNIPSIVYYFTNDMEFANQVFKLYNTFTRGNALFEEIFLDLIEKEKGTTICRPSFVQETLYNPLKTTHRVLYERNTQFCKR